MAFVILVPREEEAPAKRKAKMLDLPPSVMARVFAIMTFTAVTGSIIFNFTTNGNGELLQRARKSVAQDPGRAGVDAVRDLLTGVAAQLVVGKLIDRYPLKKIYLPIVLLQVPLFLLASQVSGLGAVHDGDRLHAAGVRRHSVHRRHDRALHRRPHAQPRHRRSAGDRVRRQLLRGGAAGPGREGRGLPDLLSVLAGVAFCSFLALSMLPSESDVHAASAAPKPAE